MIYDNIYNIRKEIRNSMLDTSSTWWKYISINKLKELLNELPENTLYITPNRVGNLTLINEDLKYIGYIDINNEKIEPYTIKN